MADFFIAKCRYWFGLLEMETLIAKRKQRFMAKILGKVSTPPDPIAGF